MKLHAAHLFSLLLVITYRQDVAPILNLRCVECHSFGSILNLSSFPFYSEKTLDQRILVEWILAKSGGNEPQMPPGNRPTLTSNQHALIQQWLDEGLAP